MMNNVVIKMDVQKRMISTTRIQHSKHALDLVARTGFVVGRNHIINIIICFRHSHMVGIPCVPRDVIVNGNYVHWYMAQPLNDGSCGDPCRYGDYGFNQANGYPLHKVGDNQQCNDEYQGCA